MATILRLTLHKKWFDEISRGIKRVEYREDKGYWRARLANRHYDEIHFKNGYRPNSPFMRVQCLGIELMDTSTEKAHYAIKLGRILEVKNGKPQSKLEKSGE